MTSLTSLSVPAPVPAWRPRWPLRLLAMQGTGLGAAAGVAVIGAAGWSVGAASATTAALLLAAGIVLDRTRAREAEERRAEQARYLAGTDALGRDLLPVWAAHIEESRAQTESAISALTQRFGGIVERLGAALQAAGENGDGGIAPLLEQSERELRDVLRSLSDAVQANSALHAQVSGLSGFIQELREMAEAVSSLAQQTSLLATNAAIEAAHVGERGRGFSVLAQEMRQLSGRSGDTGKRMAEKVRVIGAAIASACASAEASQRNESASMKASESSIHAVLGRFRDATGSLEQQAADLRQASTGIQAEIVESLVQLQFQDRVSQRMTHVRHSIERLPQALAEARERFERTGALEPVDAAALLAELEATYAMADEHATHTGGAASTAAPAGDDVTFF